MKNSTADNTLIPADTITLDFIFGDIAAPFAIGLMVGYFAKKMARMALFIGGALIVLLMISEYYKVTEISGINLEQVVDSATGAAKRSSEFLVDRLSKVSSAGASAVGGFFVGFKVG